MSRRYYVMTDLEGVTGADSWSAIRPGDEDFDPQAEATLKTRLGRETNACIEGIRSVHPDATIDILDGHGAGGLYEDDLRGGNYLRVESGHVFQHLKKYEYDAMLFVGQHAMAGTYNAPLRHTLSSKGIVYYQLNGTFIGEFAGGAAAAGQEGIPTVFFAGDDKATIEAQMFVPGIETVATKYGYGEERAIHRDRDEVLADITETTAKAIRGSDRDEIEPLSDFESPYTNKIRYRQERTEVPERFDLDVIDLEQVDARTIRLRGYDLFDVYP